MTDMPERIWLDWPGAKHGEPIYTEPPERDTQAGQTEYVRADIVQALTAERDKYESAWMTAEGKLEDAVQGLEKCQEELDAYSRQEYPLDHTVHERYRQRDYDANPARITLAALKGESQ